MTRALPTATALAAALIALGTAAGAGPAPVQLAQMNVAPKIQPAPPPNLARPPAITPKIDMSRLAGEKDETKKETDANPEQVPQEAATDGASAPELARQSPEPPAARFIRSPLPQARKDGWISGLSDEAGIRGMLETYFEDNALLDDVLDSHGARSIEEFAKDFGVDAAAIKDLADTLRGHDIGIYRVELVPWLDVPMGGGDQGSGIPGMNPLDPTGGADPWDPTGSGLGGGHPAGLGLVSTKDQVAGYHHVVVRAGNTSVETTTYPDKSSWVRTTVVNPGGSVRFRDVTTNADGTESVVDITWRKNSEGEPAGEENEVRTPPHIVNGTAPPSEAEQAAAERRSNDIRNAERARERAAEEQEASGDGGKPDGDGQGGKIDKYQPADGTGAGSFCPLMLEFCRRALKEADEKKSNLLLGMVLVNPGDPDVQPRGSRLVYDPEDLVINPAGPKSGGRAPGRVVFRARIPVLINPPGPNEPQLQATQR